MRSLSSLAALTGLLATIACSETPVAPAGARQPELVTAESQPIEGTYELHFLDVSLTAVDSLPFGERLILQAHIEDAVGQPATGGSVAFQYCSLKGRPPNDIDRIDEAPLEACVSGDATWAQLRTVSVDASGNAFLDFGPVLLTPTIGFRYKYLGQGSGIANDTIEPANFHWY